MGDATRRIIEHARANGGIISTREAQALGMNRMTLSRRIDAGILIRIGRGLMALPGANSDVVLDLEAACRRLNAVVSHESAGHMHRFDGLAWAAPTVTVPHRLTHQFPGVRVHQSTDLSDDDLVQLRGLPVTTPERTIIDLAASMSDARLDFVLDRALSSGTVELTKLTEVFAGLGRRGKPGTTRIRRMLENRDASYVPPDTVLEQRLWEIMTGNGLPRPTPQFRPPWLVPTEGRVDFAYPEHRLIVEGDSRKWHLLMRSFQTDRHRDNQAQLAGWRILRFTWQDIAERPDEVTAMIRAGLVSE
jgi:very-short-patch-repair endonuclease